MITWSLFEFKWYGDQLNLNLKRQYSKKNVVILNKIKIKCTKEKFCFNIMFSNYDKANSPNRKPMSSIIRKSVVSYSGGESTFGYHAFYLQC